jgi:hypothetical protein
MPDFKPDSAALAHSWDAFVDAAIPAALPRCHREGLQDAFYAGAVAVVSILVGIGEDHISDDAAFAQLNFLMKECTGYRDIVINRDTAPDTEQGAPLKSH